MKFDVTKILSLLSSFMPKKWEVAMQSLPQWAFALIGAILTGLLSMTTWLSTQQVDTTILTVIGAVLLWFTGYNPNKPKESNGEEDGSFKG